MAKRDFYEVLGVSKNASEKEIKSAYKKATLKYHPDRYKGEDAHEKMAEINEAASVLTDADKKAQYDQYGHQAFENNGSGFNSQGFDFSDFGDIFGDLFGGGRKRQQQQKGNDLQYNMNITFEEAAFGAKKDITININDNCDTCGGEGGTGVKSCSNCNGRGTIQMQQRTIFGTQVVQQQCPKCHGKGKTVENVCNSCHGNGLKKVSKTITINVPEGIDHGESIVLRGKGEAGPNKTPNGDLYIKFSVTRHSVFERHDYDIYLEVPITMVEATLGATIEIPTLKGKVELKIPSGTQFGTKFRLSEKGIKNIHTNRYGNQFVIINVIIPTHVNKKQKDLLLELGKTDLKNDNVFSKIKKLFK